MTEPERLTVVHFDQSTLLSLRTYLECGIGLPTTIQAYTTTYLVGSDVAKHADFKSKIDRVVRLHASIHEHCSAFKKEYFEKDKAIPDKICSHFSAVEEGYPALFGYLEEINNTQDKNKQEMAVLVLKDEIEFFGGLEADTHALIRTLADFDSVGGTLDDDNQLELTLRHLDPVGTRGKTLKMLVETVKVEKEAYKMQDEELCWVRLLGYIPTALSGVPVVKSAILSINNILDDPSKSDATMNDIVAFQVQFMLKLLKDTKNKLDKAIRAARLLRGYFSAISYDLKELERRVRIHANNSGKPLAYQQQKGEAVMEEWKRLYDRADAYRQRHFDQPVEQQRNISAE